MLYENRSTESVALSKGLIKPSTPVLKIEKDPFTFHYVGDDDDVFQYFLLKFQQGDSSKNLQDAARIVTAAHTETADVFYDIVFIDTPLLVNELKQFCRKMKSKSDCRNSVVLYNKSRLNAEDIRELRKLDIVDDVINLESRAIDYVSKIALLKNFKELHISSPLRVATEKPRKVRPGKSISSILKRVFDIMIALTALIIALPIFLIVALVIKFESRGPVFYTSLRAGKGYRVFRFYKFRTMMADADERISELKQQNQYDTDNQSPVFYKFSNDPRVTRFGKFLRNCSLDEVPQFINVLKGDMSLVGNRPLPLYEAANLTTNEFVERFTATAGITGLWQVKKRGQSKMSVEERINLDITYARKENLAYDFWIMFNTPAALFQKTNV